MVGAPRARGTGIALALGAMLAIQLGAALTVGLFDEVGAAGSLWLRLAVAALVLVAVARPRLRGRPRRDLVAVVALGVASGGLNLAFYEAIARIPLGIVVTIQFLGPLGVGLVGARRPRDVLWVALAGGGVALLSAGEGSGDLDPWGLALAALAGVGWGSYILLTKHVGRVFAGVDGLALSMAVAAVVVAPAGLVAGGERLVEPGVLVAGAALSVFLLGPYWAELEALRRLPAAPFGVLMSLEPAIGAAWGFLLLAQGLALAQVMAIVLVMTASIGATLSGHPEMAEGPPPT